MENSTKAILMAAGIFFALITISLLTVMFHNMQNVSGAEDTKKQAEELKNWNAEWEAYNKQIMYGADVLTVLNKAAQVNNDNLGQKDYQITIKVLRKNGTTVPERDVRAYLEESQVLIFSCKEINYSSNTGRVNKMTFINTEE